jgi:hypothetical protein
MSDIDEVAWRYRTDVSYVLPTQVNAIAAIGTDLFAGTGSGVFLSTDSCTTWHAENAGLTNATVSAFASRDSILFVGTENGVFITSDNGSNWKDISAGLSQRTIHALMTTGKDLFAGTIGGGVWRRSLGDFGIDNVSKQQPYSFDIRVFPNPFTPGTNSVELNFITPEEGYTTCSIYDEVGREVRTLLNTKLGKGHHSLRWDGRDANGIFVTPGVYCCQLRTDSQGASIKVLVTE